MVAIRDGLPHAAMIDRTYAYVGSERVRMRSLGAPEGTTIDSAEALRAWLLRNPRAVVEAATWVVVADGALRLAPRETEHVACAGFGPVRGAGEIAFERDGERVRWCSNQSSGYCPEPSCHIALTDALARIGVPAPPAFDPSCAWRRCEACRQIHLVKDDDFTCACCAAPLPLAWNFSR